MKKILLISLFLLSSIYVSSQPARQQSYRPIKNSNWVKLKNYYLVSLFQEDKAVRKMLASDPELSCLTYVEVTW